MGQELVAGLIIRDGRLLLLQSKKHGSRRMEPPGGKRHSGETYEEALKREVTEELGAEAADLRPFGVYGTDSPEGPFEVHMYLCAIAGEPWLNEPEKFSGFGWYGPDEIEAFKKDGTLVPNMVSALEGLKRHMARQTA